VASITHISLLTDLCTCCTECLGGGGRKRIGVGAKKRDSFTRFWKWFSSDPGSEYVILTIFIITVFLFLKKWDQ
jgi:hypothetical protein